MTADPPEAERPRPLDVVALITLLVATGAAILIYMGWAYLDGYLRPFSLKPTDLNYRPDEYALYGLNLFSPAYLPWMTAVPLALVMVAHRQDLLPLVPARLRAAGGAVRSHRVLRRLGHSVAVGAVITVAAMVLAAAALSGRAISTYLLLAPAIVGPLLLTWPSRGTPLGRVAFAMAAAVSIFCLLWAAAVYALQRGTHMAWSVMERPADQPQVALYSADTLAVNALNVGRETFGQGAFKYRYTGLRLLLVRGETYYLIPAIPRADWAKGHGRTFVFKEEDDIRLEILPGSRQS
ncbi:hypothetical protein [Nonomuraea endophytica]|uniref:Uncharacterized protein n=1 Tax=Nonomuraea endophytica TaxID=714136 RepID=A0A7W8EM52_9ACTN|nr:hypothetical protein [Nonomuraea endophytica]MBB5083592.1 hypothetical protein [Nonomuraea endophytica]